MFNRHERIRAVQGIAGLTIVCLLICIAALPPSCFAEDGNTVVAHLYFGDARNPFLVAEARVMANPGDSALLGRMVVEKLIEGPVGGHHPTLPEGTQLRAFYLLDDGMAVVDFSPQFKENHPGGCRMEQLTLFSVVNSLILNVSEIKRVKVLINGAEAQTLAGHLTLDYPLTADMLLTR